MSKKSFRADALGQWNVTRKEVLTDSFFADAWDQSLMTTVVIMPCLFQAAQQQKGDSYRFRSTFPLTVGLMMIRTISLGCISMLNILL